MRFRTLVVFVAILAGQGCATNAILVSSEPLAPSSAGDRGNLHRPITTKSPKAQEYFDRGLFLCYAFDHEQADVAFRKALEHDPECAMAWWGIAYAAGPNINNIAMDDARNAIASRAIVEAVRLSPGASPVEQQLIAALSKRYSDPPPADRRTLDENYAAAMREVYQANKNDPDIGAIFAESLMDLYAWDIWSPHGEPRPITIELVEVLETTLKQHPRHLGANHDYIHTMEASLQPGKADGAAEVLRTAAPGAPHLVHMPSHIDIRQGRYEKAVISNENAIKADARRTEAVGAGGFFALYRAHNYHFLQYAAMFEGRKALAMEAARGTVRALPESTVDAYVLMLEGFLASPYHAMVRFGMWDEILAEPEPPANRPVTRATHFYARGIAHASSNHVAEARKEYDAFLAALAKVSPDAYMGNNTAIAVLAVGQNMLEGEIEYRAGNYEIAFESLRSAVAKNDALKYDEPWGWMQPPRHALGALLLEQGHIAEAESVYRADLARHPGNGWSLLGLSECLERSGKKSDAAKTLAQAKQAWARADVPLKTSCYCRTIVAR